MFYAFDKYLLKINNKDSRSTSMSVVQVSIVDFEQLLSSLND